MQRRRNESVSRGNYYLMYSRRSGRVLNVRFLEEDVFKVLDAEHFDLVWVTEAISHIDSAEAFLERVAENLGSNGYVVISDSNVLNPVMAWRTFNLRRRGDSQHSCDHGEWGQNLICSRASVHSWPNG